MLCFCVFYYQLLLYVCLFGFLVQVLWCPPNIWKSFQMWYCAIELHRAVACRHVKLQNLCCSDRLTLIPLSPKWNAIIRVFNRSSQNQVSMLVYCSCFTHGSWKNCITNLWVFENAIDGSSATLLVDIAYRPVIIINDCAFGFLL